MLVTTKFKSRFDYLIEGTNKKDLVKSSHYMGYREKTKQGLKNCVFFDTESTSQCFIKNKEVSREFYNKSMDNTKEMVFHLKTIQACFVEVKKKNKKEVIETRYKLYIIGDSEYKEESYYCNYENEITGEIINIFAPVAYFENAVDAITEFYNDIMNVKKPKIFCHNSKHDWMQIHLFKFNEYFDIELNSFNLTTPRFSIWENDENKLTFLDTTNYFFQPLKKLGKTVGVIKASEKVDFTKDIVVDDDFLYYGLLDVEILYRKMFSYSNQVKEYGKLKYGTAGTAFNIFLTSFLNDKIWLHKNPELTKLERLSYFGGRTEAYKLGYYSNIYGIDINSSYPYQYSKDLPMSYSKTIETSSKDEYIPHYVYKNSKQNFCTMVEAVVNSNLEIPIIPYRLNGKLVFVNGNNIEVTLCQPEIDLLIEMGAEVKIKKIHCYKKGQPMKEFSNYFMNMKVEGKNEKDEVKADFGKLNANSSYGKLAEREIQSITMNSNGNIGYYTIFNTATGKEEIFKELGGLCVRSWKTDNDASEAYCIMGSYITSYARVHLYRAMAKIGKENLVYGDTDSIYFILPDKYNNVEDYLKDIGIECNKTKIGAWDIEEKNIKMVVYGAKDYIKIDSNNELIKQKLKGINLKNSIKMEENAYFCERWEGFTYGIRHQDITHQHIIIMEKVLTREYNKAKIITPNTRKFAQYTENGQNQKVNFIQSELTHFEMTGNNVIM